MKKNEVAVNCLHFKVYTGLLKTALIICGRPKKYFDRFLHLFSGAEIWYDDTVNRRAGRPFSGAQNRKGVL